jgi:hypothetical protein
MSVRIAEELEVKPNQVCRQRPQRSQEPDDRAQVTTALVRTSMRQLAALALLPESCRLQRRRGWQ